MISRVFNEVHLMEASSDSFNAAPNNGMQRTRESAALLYSMFSARPLILEFNGFAHRRRNKLKMLLRVLVGLLVGGISGSAIGAISFAVGESLFGRGIGVLVKSPLLAALIGIVFIGAPGLLVGAIVGGLNLRKLQAVAAGAAIGLCMILLFVLRNESRYFYENGYFDKQLFLYDVVINVTWLLGLVIVSAIVSASVRRLFAPGE